MVVVEGMGAGGGAVVAVGTTGADLSSLLFFSYLPPWYTGQQSSLLLFTLPVSSGGGTGAGVGAGAAEVGLGYMGGAGTGAGRGLGAVEGVTAGAVVVGVTPATLGPASITGGCLTSRLPAHNIRLPSTPKTTLLNI